MAQNVVYPDEYSHSLDKNVPFMFDRVVYNFHFDQKLFDSVISDLYDLSITER